MTPGAYASEHASALADVSAAGAAVTFTRTTTTVNETTGVVTPSTSAIAGAAIQVGGNPMLYEALGLILSDAPTLFVTPTTYGDLPLPGDTVTWNGIAYTVKNVRPVAPDGVAMAARVVIAR